MDTVEYARLTAELDCQLAVLKRKEEQRKRREEMEQRVKLLDHWISGLQARVDAITAAGEVPVDGAAGKLQELRKERESLAARLELKPELWPEGRKELEELAAEMESQRLEGLTAEQCWLTYEAWACRWKMVVDRLEEVVVQHDFLVRRCYAMIREWMNRHEPGLWYIKALDKNEVRYDAAARLAECRLQLAAIESARKARASAMAEEARKEDEREEAQDAAIWNLGAAVRGMSEALEYHVRGMAKDTVEEADRKLRHCLRQAAKFENLREEAGDLARQHRGRLEPEFSFLWPKAPAAEEAPTARKLSMRDIVARMLRRMKAKGMIGGSHCPAEFVGRGVPEHDRGRAKEALEAMSKFGILRSRDTQIGTRLSIEPKRVPAVEQFLEGGPLGVDGADEWIGNAG